MKDVIMENTIQEKPEKLRLDQRRLSSGTVITLPPGIKQHMKNIELLARLVVERDPPAWWRGNK